MLRRAARAARLEAQACSCPSFETAAFRDLLRMRVILLIR
jgi:hypothetical protein